MRKLVSIQEIRAIEDIPNAEMIQVAKVLGWSVVIKKEEFKVGDKVVYAEIDSVFPEKENFEFLRKNKFRIRTIKLRGQVSQGICFPLSILPEGDYQIDQDVTELIGVTKFEPPVPTCLEGVMKGLFPSFIPKTDETRVQVLQKKLTRFAGVRFVSTEKLDGTSTTYFKNGESFGVCSRNLELDMNEDNVLWKLAISLKVEDKLNKLGRNLALQGETIGSGIQSNKYKLSPGENRFYLFNIFDIDTQSYVDYEEFISLAKELGVDTVPILDTNFILTDNIDDLVKSSTGFSILNSTTKREGLVYKSYNKIERDTVFHFKAINPEFLLKYEDA